MLDVRRRVVVGIVHVVLVRLTRTGVTYVCICLCAIKVWQDINQMSEKTHTYICEGCTCILKKMFWNNNKHTYVHMQCKNTINDFTFDRSLSQTGYVFLLYFWLEMGHIFVHAQTISTCISMRQWSVVALKVLYSGMSWAIIFRKTKNIYVQKQKLKFSEFFYKFNINFY